MFRAVVLVLGCLLQRKLVTTEGHSGTNCHVFYAVHMDGGIGAARALAEQHRLEFIQRVSACFKPLMLPPPVGPALLHFLHPVIEVRFSRAAKVLTSASCWMDIWLASTFLNISYLIKDPLRRLSTQWHTHIHTKRHIDAPRKAHVYTLFIQQSSSLRTSYMWNRIQLNVFGDD